MELSAALQIEGRARPGIHTRTLTRWRGEMDAAADKRPGASLHKPAWEWRVHPMAYNSGSAIGERVVRPLTTG